MASTSDSDGARPPRGPSGLSLAVLGGGLLFTLAVVAVLVHLGVHTEVLRLLEDLRARGWVALLVFIAVMALIMVFLVPGILFTAGAGAVFGVMEGSVAVVIGTTLGAATAFLIARGLLGERVARRIRAHARAAAIDDELAAQGWRFVALTRLVPFFPFKLSNYAFGLTRVPLRSFVAGTFLGVIPWSVHNVYLGALAADLGGLREVDRGPLGWAFYVAGFLAAVALVWYAHRIASRALGRAGRQG